MDETLRRDLDERTGYANGDTFGTPEEVRDYFTVENMRYMFGGDDAWTQDELDEMADYVIENELHCAFAPPASVIGTPEDRAADADRALSRCVAELKSERREKIRNRANQIAASYAPGTAHTASTPEEYDEAETAVWREALREIDAAAGADD